MNYLSVEDITNAQIGTALNALGGQIYAAVASGLGFSPDPAVSAGDVATALNVNPPTANPADPDTIAFNNAVQQAGIVGTRSRREADDPVDPDICLVCTGPRRFRSGRGVSGWRHLCCWLYPLWSGL